MRPESDLYNYQKTAVDHILATNGSMLWLDIGLGKTVISLTAIEHLLDAYEIKATLVVAPVAVIKTVWMQEAAEWAHTKRLTFSMVRGTPKQRLAALRKTADVYLINYEQLQWLETVLQKEWLKKKQPLPFDMVVFDEISKMKHSTAKRGRAFCKILPYFHYRVGLTGTPATNGLIDLHGQFLIVDGGFRLGPNITGYRERWFTLNQYSRRYVPRMGAMKAIEERIYDITLEMSQEQYLPELPPLVDVDRLLTLPDEVMEKYLEFEEEFFIEIGEDEVEAFNAAAKSMKCRQLANGAVYTSEDRSQWTLFHDEKLDMLEEIVEELNGEPLLIGYQFKHDAARIKERFPDAVFLDSKNVAEKVKLWNDGKIKILAGHPASMGHGLNLQHGGHHICWFGLPWALELYQQLIGRLLRNGQKGSKIFNHRLIAKGTVEEIMATVVKQKDATQKTLRDAVKRYRETKGA